MHLFWTAILGLVACQTGDPGDPAPGTTPPGTETPPDDPSPWTFTPDDDPTGEVDLAAVATALDRAVVDALAIDARPVVQAYDGLLQRSADPMCPFTYPDGYGGLYWQSACTATDGSYYGGYLSHYEYDDLPDTDYILNGTTLSGVITVNGSDGTTLDLEGEAFYITGVSYDGLSDIVQSYINGGFYWDGGNPGWLDGGRQAVSVLLTGVTYPSFNGLLVIVDGAVNLDVDGETYSVVFNDSTVGNAIMGSACDLEPGGTVDIRDSAGRWLQVAFDGPVLDVTEGDAARCDGCGDATLDGEDLGEVCADFSPWFDWEAVQ